MKGEPIYIAKLRRVDHGGFDNPVFVMGVYSTKLRAIDALARLIRDEKIIASFWQTEGDIFSRETIKMMFETAWRVMADDSFYYEVVGRNVRLECTIVETFLDADQYNTNG